MKIALISLEPKWLDKGKNLGRCRELALDAARQGCMLVVFPEMTLTGYTTTEVEQVAESAENSSTIHQFGQIAMESGIDIIYGACLLDEKSGKPRNTLCLASHRGESKPIYSKMHPFSYAGEDKTFEAGDSPGYVDLQGVRLGSSICYDLRFPELFSAMALQSQAAVCIANWPSSRIAHWNALMVARAIENQMFMIGVNCIGVDHKGNRYEKSSMIIAPDGTVVQPLWRSPEMDIYAIDLVETSRYRDTFPTVRDKRYGLYAKLFGVTDVE